MIGEMKIVQLEVPDDVAAALEEVDEQKRLALVDTIAAFLMGATRTDLDRRFELLREEGIAWQATKGVTNDDFEKVFAELCEED